MCPNGLPECRRQLIIYQFDIELLILVVFLTFMPVYMKNFTVSHLSKGRKESRFYPSRALLWQRSPNVLTNCGRHSYSALTQQHCSTTAALLKSISMLTEVPFMLALRYSI